MVDDSPPWIDVFPKDFHSKAKYFSENETYDMTDIASGIYIDVLKYAEKTFNFTTKLYLRKDGNWGIPKKSSNGTIVLNGMLQSLVEDLSVDFIWAPFAMFEMRAPYVNYLPPINNGYGAIFLPYENKKLKIMDWTVYLEPFTKHLWMMVLTTSGILTVFVCIIKWFHLNDIQVSKIFFIILQQA